MSDVSTTTGNLWLPTMENVESLREPIDWQEHLTHDTEADIERKRQLARHLGLPAVYFVEDVVHDRIQEMALVQHAQRTGETDLHIGVRQGGLPFFYHLMDEMSSFMPYKYPITDGMEASRYQKGQKGKEAIRTTNGLDPDTIVEGMDVTAYDDLADHGTTLRLMSKMFMSGRGYRRRGRSKSFGVAILADKGIAGLEEDFEASRILVGFNIPKPWASGKGMNGNKNVHRHTRHLGMSPVQHPDNKDDVAETLELLGPRAVMSIDEIIWKRDED